MTSYPYHCIQAWHFHHTAIYKHDSLTIHNTQVWHSFHIAIPKCSKDNQFIFCLHFHKYVAVSRKFYGYVCLRACDVYMYLCVCTFMHRCVCVSVLQKSGFCVFFYFLLLNCQIQDLSQKLISAARLVDIELHRSIYQLWDHKHLLLCDALCEHWGNRSQNHMPGICIL